MASLAQIDRPLRAPKSVDEAANRARALFGDIRARAAQTESDRRLPLASVEAMRDAGLFAVATPKLFGGSALGVGAMVDVAIELAAACGSTGWVYGVLTGHNWMITMFPESAQRAVFANSDSLIATVFRLGSTVVPEGDGYRMTDGEGRFCSGVDFADWVIVGSSVRREAGAEPGFFLVPMAEVEVVDDWFTAGMRGTGSKTIRIKDAFIPADRFVAISDIMKGDTPGARFHDSPAQRLTPALAQPFSLIGTVLGIAKGAVAEVAASNAPKLAKMPTDQLGEQAVFFARLAKASVEVDAAIALVRARAAFIDAHPNPATMTALERARVKRDIGYAAQQCRYAVTSLFEAAGGSGIYDGSPMQRMWRDVNSAAAHVAFAWDAAASNFGRALMDLPASRYTPV